MTYKIEATLIVDDADLDTFMDEISDNATISKLLIEEIPEEEAA